MSKLQAGDSFQDFVGPLGVASEFVEEDIEVLNGRFGAYIKHGGENYKIPKGTDAKALTLEECLNIIKTVKPSGSKKSAKSK